VARILHISDAASLALHAAVLLASSSPRPLRSKEIADTIHASETHLSKVLQRLARAGLVRSTRGPKGGFVLADDPEAISLLDIFEAIEGPLRPTTCLLDKPLCDGRCCIFGGTLQKAGEIVRRHLAATKLSRLVKGGPYACAYAKKNHQD